MRSRWRDIMYAAEADGFQPAVVTAAKAALEGAVLARSQFLPGGHDTARQPQCTSTKWTMYFSAPTSVFWWRADAAKRQEGSGPMRRYAPPMPISNIASSEHLPAPRWK